MSTSCATPESLLAYATGQFNGLEKASIEAHLEKCEHCCVQLSQVWDNTDLTGSPVNGAAGTFSLPSDPAVGHPAYELYVRNLNSVHLASPPTTIGRYRIKDMLGAGGFGVVYLAEDEKLGRKVAIKVPHARLTAQAELLDLMLREAKTVAQLDHPHIVPIYDVGSSDEYPIYLVTKMIDGLNLAQCLRRGVSEVEAIEWSIQIASALSYAHSAGVIHRDVKPQNILVDADGHICLTDFGLAHSQSDDLAQNPNAGTPAYMSPEQQAGNQAVDVRADIYALGRVLTDLSLSSRESNPSTVCGTNDWAALSASGRSELAAICERACHTEPHLRFTSAKEFSEALLDYAAKRGLSILRANARSPSYVMPFQNAHARRASYAMRWSMIVAAVIIMSLTAYYWIAAARADRERADRERADVAEFVKNPSHTNFTRLQNLTPVGIGQLWSHTESDDPNEQLAAKLALMKEHSELTREVVTAILTTEDRLVPLLLSAYGERKPEIKQRALAILNEQNLEAEPRLNVVSFLVKYFTDDRLWHDRESMRSIIRAWIDADSELRSSYQAALRPLIAHFASIMQDTVIKIPDRQSAESMRVITAWEQLVEGDYSQQINCLIECPICLVNPLLEKMKVHGDLKDRLRPILHSQGPGPDDPFILNMYRAECVAAYCLLQLGEPDAFWDFARHREIPDVENSFVKFCDESNLVLTLLSRQLLDRDLLKPLARSPHIADELLFSPELSTRRTILQALFNSDKWTHLQPAPFDAILARLRTLAIDEADPGMQAIACRVLKGLTPIEQWSVRPWLDPEAVRKSDSDRSWSLNSLKMVLVHVDKPKECDHSYCLGQCEIDVAAFEQFIEESGYAWRPPGDEVSAHDPSRLVRPRNFVSWYDCAAFCNWLSSREGLDECYSPVGGSSDGMVLKPNALRLNGYRLPTNQEWEIGCRAGAKSPYANGYHFRPSYGWTSLSTSQVQPTGILFPNALGLFDVHGNVSEWVLCGPELDCVNEPIQEPIVSLCRGGDYASPPTRASFDHLETHPLTTRQATIGFRIARTLSKP